MSQWMFNSVTITGPQDVLDRVPATLAGTGRDGQPSVFSFASVVPPPEGLAGDSDPVRVTNWFLSSWGALDEPCNVVLEVADGRLSYGFDTPDGAPIKIFNALAARWPELRFEVRYVLETGRGGWIRYSYGDLLSAESWSTPSTHAELVKRFGRCHCDDQSQYFDDCFAGRAATLGVLTGDELATAKALGVGWAGTFDEMLVAARSL